MTITCDSKKETERLRKEVEQKLGSKYEVKQIQKVKPSLKIIGIDQEMEKERFVQTIMHQNSDLKISGMEVIVFKKMKTKYMAIVQVEGGVYNAMMKAGK